MSTKAPRAAAARPTLDVLISLGRALALEVQDLVDNPAIAHADPEVPAGTGAAPPLP